MSFADGPAESGQTPQSLTDERLAGIAARERAATRGPWGFYDGGDYADLAAGYERTGRGSYSCRQHLARLESKYHSDDAAHEDWDDEQAEQQLRADAEFVAHAREDVPVLLAEVDRLRSRVAELEALAADAVEYRVPGRDGARLLVQRSERTGRWSVGDGLLRALEPGGWGFALDLPDAELYCWPDAATAITAARRALGGGAS